MHFGRKKQEPTGEGERGQWGRKKGPKYQRIRRWSWAKALSVSLIEAASKPRYAGSGVKGVVCSV